MTRPTDLLLAHLRVGDVIDFQTLGDGDWFIGLTVQDLDDASMIVKPVHKRPVSELGIHPFWVPLDSVGWLRFGTGEDTFTDPANDPPPDHGDPEGED